MNRATRTGLFVLPILLSLGLALPAAGSVYTDVVVADDPVAYWPLDETSTSSPALDLSSNHHNGVYGGSVTLGTASASASLGTAATFDTTDDEVNVTGVGTDYQFANNFTLEAWVKRRSTGTVGMILSTGDWYMGHYPSGTDDCFRFTTLGVRDYSFPTLFPYDTWTHVAAVMDGNNDVSLYFNGQFQTKLTHTLPGHTASSTLRIGAYVSGGSYDWQGEIDEVAVYGKALSSAQIANHYATGATGVKLPVADVAVYHLDEGTGGTAHDATWPQQHGTVHGATWTAGKWDSALTFDGVDDYVETTLTEAVALPLSVEAWVKTTDASGGIVNKYQSGSYNGFQVFMNAGHLGAWYLASWPFTWGGPWAGRPTPGRPPRCDSARIPTPPASPASSSTARSTRWPSTAGPSRPTKPSPASWPVPRAPTSPSPPPSSWPRWA